LDTGGMLRRSGQLVSILLALALLSQALWAGMLELPCACCRPAGTADARPAGEGDACAAATVPACCRAKAAAKAPPAAPPTKTSSSRPVGCPPQGCSGCFCAMEEDRFVERNLVYAESTPRTALVDLPSTHHAQDSPVTIALGRWRYEALWATPPAPLHALYCVWRN
jgi:hypothetical protein